MTTTVNFKDIGNKLLTEKLFSHLTESSPFMTSKTGSCHLSGVDELDIDGGELMEGMEGNDD